MVVAERRTSADRGAGALDRLQPSNWPLHRVHRRQHGGHARGIDRLQGSGDQAHVVVRRQPGDAARAGPDAEPAHGGFEVIDQVAVAHHDAFGVSGRTGRVLQQREIRRIGRSTVHRDLGGPGIGADDEPRHLSERGVGRKLGGDAGVRACVGEHHRRMAIAHMADSVPARRRARGGKLGTATRRA